MLLAHPGRTADDEMVHDFIAQAQPPRIDLARLRVAERRGRVLWAALPLLSPGRTALLLSAPVPTTASDLSAAGGLIELVCQELTDQGIHLTQALLDPGDSRARRLFESHQFRSLAELLYLSAPAPRKRQPPPALPEGFQWVGYEPGPVHELFKQTIARTYENSLDCPALNGLRDMEDVVAGHRASGEFDPKLWRLLCQPPIDAGGRPEPIAVLLLAKVPQAGSVELVYLGLVPEARGRRLGDLLVRHALAAVAAAGLGRLTLAVDSRNVPALKVYYRNGLAKVGSKVATLRDLRPIIAAGPVGTSPSNDPSIAERAHDVPAHANRPVVPDVTSVMAVARAVAEHSDAVVEGVVLAAVTLPETAETAPMAEPAASSGEAPPENDTASRTE
jgi:ribosomal protein S18 acetylase RimI-like enzyme